MINSNKKPWLRRKIDTKYVHVANEQVYVTKRNTNIASNEKPVEIIWMPV